jgi:hypothetical protein
VSGFRARRPRQDASHECDYRDAVVRVRIELTQLQALHGSNTMVSSALVLDLLNSRGMWKFVDKPVAAAPDEDADPLTGCKPVTAQQKPAGLPAGFRGHRRSVTVVLSAACFLAR